MSNEFSQTVARIILGIASLGFMLCFLYMLKIELRYMRRMDPQGSWCSNIVVVILLIAIFVTCFTLVAAIINLPI